MSRTEQHPHDTVGPGSSFPEIDRDVVKAFSINALAWRFPDVLRGRLSLKPTDSDPEEGTTQTVSSLYECSECEEVYVANDMQTCPECRSTVIDVPNEPDLGLDH